MKPIEKWQDKRLYCAFCGTDKSVKFILTVNVNNRKASICCCNKCAIFHENEEVM